MRKLLMIGMLLASSCTLARADDKEATKTAYCIGVHQRDIDELKTGIVHGSASAKAKLKDLELRKERRQALLEHAVKQKIIAYVAAAKMTGVGYADAKLCGLNTEQCMKDFVGRDTKKVDKEENNKVLENCNKETEPVCERAYKNCD